MLLVFVSLVAIIGAVMLGPRHWYSTQIRGVCDQTIRMMVSIRLRTQDELGMLPRQATAAQLGRATAPLEVMWSHAEKLTRLQFYILQCGMPISPMAPPRLWRRCSFSTLSASTSRSARHTAVRRSAPGTSPASALWKNVTCAGYDGHNL